MLLLPWGIVEKISAHSFSIFFMVHFSALPNKISVNSTFIGGVCSSVISTNMYSSIHDFLCKLSAIFSEWQF